MNNLHQDIRLFIVEPKIWTANKQSGQIAESGSQTILANDCQIWQYHP